MSEVDRKEELLKEHRKQKKELQGKITGIKKKVPKGDKARAKETKKEIENLENDLKLKQEKELNELTEQLNSESINDVADKVDDVVLEETEEVNEKPRVSKAQKKRDKKAAKAKEVAARLAAADADYVNTQRFKEEKKIREKLKELGLTIKPIKSDGNCMFSAVLDQLQSPSHRFASLDELRCEAASYMRRNEAEFIPFITNKNTGDMFTHEEFEDYCAEIEKPSTWGGQIEILALSQILKTPIHVVQATAPVSIHGEEHDMKPIILTYHRHELGLGEHYNSVTEYKDSNDDDNAS